MHNEEKQAKSLRRILTDKSYLYDKAWVYTRREDEWRHGTRTNPIVSYQLCIVKDEHIWEAEGSLKVIREKLEEFRTWVRLQSVMA